MFRKDNPGFMERLAECATLDEETGIVTFKNMYAVSHLNMGWGGTVIATPYSHVVWFLKYKRWPKKGYHIDHINDDPFDNRPENLQEITEDENQRKRRGRMVYRSYGKGKYGYGVQVTCDKRDGRYYVSRQLSRGHGEGDLKGVKRSFGGHNTLEEAEATVAQIIEEVKEKGLNYFPETVRKSIPPKSHTLEEKIEIRKIRTLRRLGQPYQDIAKIIGRSLTYVYNRCNNVQKET